jgi:hypothetical protein
LARCVVADLERDRVMVPSSFKGRGNRKADRVPVPVTQGLAGKLKAAAAGRPADALLLRRANGTAWHPKLADHRHAFERAARAAKLPPGTTMYSLRHSSIARALLRSLPIKVVADLHNTSIGQIEAHYGRFIRHHYDDLVRGALLDTTPAPPAAVVPLRRA